MGRQTDLDIKALPVVDWVPNPGTIQLDVRLGLLAIAEDVVKQNDISDRACHDPCMPLNTRQVKLFQREEKEQRKKNKPPGWPVTQSWLKLLLHCCRM